METKPPSDDALKQFVFHARVALGCWLDGDGKKPCFEQAMEALDDASVKLEKVPPSDAAQPAGESEAMQQLSRAVRTALSEIPGFTEALVSGTPRVKPELSADAMLGMQDAFLQYVTAIGVEMLDERKDGNHAEREG